MKRKGFTLVELLIIVAIIGALAATMMVSTGSSIASAKAAAIANNLRACTAGAQAYYLENAEDSTTLIGNVTCSAMLEDAVPNFTDFSEGNIQYTADGSGPDNWAITVTLSGTDKDDIKDALVKIRGFSSASTTTTYKVFAGTIQGTSTPDPDPDPDPNPNP